MASPQTVTTSDLARGGCRASSSRIQRSIRRRRAAAAERATAFTDPSDTEIARPIAKVYRFPEGSGTPGPETTHVRADGRHGAEAPALARGNAGRGACLS